MKNGVVEQGWPLQRRKMAHARQMHQLGTGDALGEILSVFRLDKFIVFAFNKIANNIDYIFHF